MKTYSRFIIGFVTAAVTFGSLMYFVGPRHCEHAHYRHHHYYQHHNGCDGQHNPQAPISDSSHNL